jgi:hypothetical protein
LQNASSVSRFLVLPRLTHGPNVRVRKEEPTMSIRKFAALIPVCALMAACGGESTPDAKAPEGGAAAAEETKPADATKPADSGDAAKPADSGDAAKPADSGDAAKPADGADAK